MQYSFTGFCRVCKQMTVCEQIRVCTMVVDCFCDPGLHRNRCCTVLHCSKVIYFNCGLSNANVLVSVISNEICKTSVPKRRIGRALVVILKKIYLGYHWSQHIYYIPITCSCERGTEKECSSLSNTQQTTATQQETAYPYMHGLVKLKLTISCATASMEHRLLRIYLQLLLQRMLE